MQVDIVLFLLDTNDEVVVPNRVGSSAEKMFMPNIEVGDRIYAHGLDSCYNPARDHHAGRTLLRKAIEVHGLDAKRIVHLDAKSVQALL